MTANRMFTVRPSIAANSTPLGDDEQRRELRVELRQRAVGDGDPLADARRLQLLALDQHPLDRRRVDARARGEHRGEQSRWRSALSSGRVRAVVVDGDPLVG